MRSGFLTAVVLLVVGAATATPAAAAPGVRVTLPAAGCVAPGSTVRVSVRTLRPAGRGRLVTAVLVPVDPAGRKAGPVVLHRRLRAGRGVLRLRLVVPQGDGRTYRLEIRVGGRTRSVRLCTPVASTVAPDAPPAAGCVPTGPVQAMFGLAYGGFSAAPGGTLRMSLGNDAPSCVALGAVRWEVRGPDGFVPYRDAPALGAPELAAGEHRTLDIAVPADFPAEAFYRLLVQATGAEGAVPLASQPIEVTTCTYPAPQAKMAFDKDTAVAGETVAYGLTNTGSGCLGTSQSYRWQRQDADRWVAVDAPSPDRGPSIRLRPGEELRSSATIPASFTPGRYRLQKDVAASDIAGSASAEIEVRAAE